MSRPIQATMETTLQKIRDMVDVDTVIGKPIVVDEARTVIPFSKVSFGFLSGGGELTNDVLKSSPSSDENEELNFIGGGASGVSIKPLGFIVSDENGIKLMSTDYDSPIDRAIDSIPRLIEEIKRIVSKSNEKQTS